MLDRLLNLLFSLEKAQEKRSEVKDITETFIFLCLSLLCFYAS